MTLLRPSRAPQKRDMDESRFTVILADFVQRVPGAFAAALVDSEGETVDYAGVGDVFDLRVAAAHAQLILRDVARLGTLGDPAWITIRGARRTLMIRALAEGYALVVLLRRRAGFTASRRAFSVCAHALAAEAGWDAPSARTRERRWYPVDVEVDARGRPRRVGPNLRVEVLGALVGLSPCERGFRVRATTGTELTLVREPGRRWYADEALETQS